MTFSELHYLILAGVVGLVFKVIWDWLLNRVPKKNGVHLAEQMEQFRIVLNEMHERQKKMWEHQLEHESRDDK